jgi:hypothetical protein
MLDMQSRNRAVWGTAGEANGEGQGSYQRVAAAAVPAARTAPRRRGAEYEPGEVKQMIDALEDAVAEVKRKFARKKEPNKKVGFTFTSIKRSAA